MNWLNGLGIASSQFLQPYNSSKNLIYKLEYMLIGGWEIFFDREELVLFYCSSTKGYIQGFDDLY